MGDGFHFHFAREGYNIFKSVQNNCAFLKIKFNPWAKLRVQEMFKVIVLNMNTFLIIMRNSWNFLDLLNMVE